MERIDSETLFRDNFCEIGIGVDGKGYYCDILSDFAEMSALKARHVAKRLNSGELGVLKFITL